MFALPDKWVWDFWFAEDGGDHHLFYLQAPRTLGDPELRHHHATIGHAVSADFASWQVLPDALTPGEAGSWDDLAVWTGSAIAHGGGWSMLYTGISRSEGGLVQRIGLATSTDLLHWEKHPDNPVLEADPRFYEQLDQGRWRDQSWRDPWLFRHGDDGYVHALITARSPCGPPDGAGVVAHARSRDLVAWEVLPPLTEPGEFAQVEVPQLVELGGSHVVLFSCLAEDHSKRRRERLGAAGRAGTFAFCSTSLLGPYRPTDEPIAPPSPTRGVLYAGKIVGTGPGRHGLVGFRMGNGSAFVGELDGPLPVSADGQAGVVLDAG
jgi:beta-fructofuranosidase